MSSLELIVYGFVSVISGILGGIAGGGGGFIITPLLILLGLSPAQAVATGKLSGLSVTLASLQRLGREKLHSWKLVIPMMFLATVVGLLSSLVIRQLESEVYRTILGIILVLMAPIMILRKVGHQPKDVSQLRKIIGWVLLVMTMLLQGIFSAGLGTLVNVVLMSMLGLSALQATVTKRFSQILLNSVIILGVLGSGLIVWKVAAVGVVTAAIGAAIGARIAVKKGDKFVSYVFAVLMFIAALELLLG